MTGECRRIQDLLVELLDGELSAESRALVERHLEACHSCSEERAALERTLGALRADGYREPSPFCWTRFDAGLRRRLEGERCPALEAARGRAAGRSGTALAPKLVPIAVAALCFVVGLWIGLAPSTPTYGPAGTVSVAQAPEEVRPVPVISPESKLLVESGFDRHPVCAADTLRPNALAPFGEPPDMVLASSPRISVIEPGLGQRPPGR